MLFLSPYRFLSFLPQFPVLFLCKYFRFLVSISLAFLQVIIWAHENILSFNLKMFAERSKLFCFFNVHFIVKKKETHEFESMKFRTPSILSTSLNLIQAKVDFWGIFRLSFKSNLGSGTFLGPNSLCDGRKRDANHRLSQTYSKLDLITSWLHFPCFQQFSCFSLRPLIDSREFLCFSFTKTQCTRNPCFLCVLVIPWCFAPKPIWSSIQLKTTFTLEKLAEKIEVKCRACNERGSIDVVAQHTCPDALISCSNRSCQRSIKRKDAPTHNKVSRQSSQANNATRTPPWPTRNFILRRLAQG